MNAKNSAMSRDDVLESFLLEDTHDAKTLERYLRDYPEHSGALIELSREIAREVPIGDAALTPAEQSRIDAAWIVYKAAASVTSPDPLTSMSVETSKQIANSLGVPRQVVTCFRERKVDASTVPRWVLGRFANFSGTTVGQLAGLLALPVQPALARSYKSDGKPGSPGKASFEQILIDAGVSDSERARLLADDE